jgi:NACalpha-BTF3-like transcription factor
VEELGGVCIIFKPKKTSYKSKAEEDAVREGKGESKKKKDPPKEGGVEIRVEKLTKGEVQLVAKRCEVDEDTMIKEMSEETIIAELKKAIDTWKKQ